MDARANLELRLAFELQLLDVREVKARLKRNSEKLGDFDTALNLFEQHLIAEIQSLHDRELARRFATHRSLEPSSAPISQRLPSVPHMSSAGPSQKPKSAPRAKPKQPARSRPNQVEIRFDDDSMMNQEWQSKGAPYTAAKYYPSSKNKASAAAAPSNTRASGKEKQKPAHVRCAACGDRQYYNSVARVPCGHFYCPDCLAHCFQSAIDKRAAFPPRCCAQPIPFDWASQWLPDKLIAKSRERQAESRTSTADWLYCSNKRCARLIPPKNIVGDDGACAACNHWTCKFCKAKHHAGLCTADPAKQQLEALAAKNGWQECYNCQALVELAPGCNHISEFIHESHTFHVLIMQLTICTSLFLRQGILPSLRTPMAYMSVFLLD